ncbi:unnamed protein product [marine sediment metagenome]|uniref:Uncharacterized protein n=1 Tax=marine sediment metagenome TaxID=412755 RepID=X1TE36_9ZZZZ
MPLTITQIVNFKEMGKYVPRRPNISPKKEKSSFWSVMLR